MRFAAMVLGCAALCRLCAQTSTATLVGIAQDPSGALVAGAAVEVRNENTNALRKSESDGKGEFIVPNLAPGTYAVTIVKEGFRTLRQTGLKLQVDQEVRLEFPLEIGAVSQTVSVEASVPLVNTENSVKGDVMVSQEILEMPLISRDFTDLSFLTPGVVQNTPGAGGSSSSPMAINGARADNSNFVIDGFNDRDPRDASAQVHPNIDALQEFKMQVSGYSADSGRQAGGVMSMVLKTGGNQFHGAMFEFFRNNALNARNFFDKAQPSTLRRNQFGASVDGPVRFPKIYNGRDRTFFVFSWESYRQNAPSPVLSVVPSLAQRQGDFSGLPAIKDPLAAGAVFPNSQIPLARQSSTALAAQAFYPLPNNAGVNNLYANAAAPSAADNYVAKVDQRIGPSGNLSFKYLANQGSSVAPYNGGNTGRFGLTGWSHSKLAGLTYTQTFSPAVVNEARFGVTRTVGHYEPAGTGTNYAAQWGLPGPSDPSLYGFPLIMVSNYNQLGGAPGFPNTYYSTNFTLSEALTWVRGSHLIKLGGDILRNQIVETASTNTRGTYQFTGFWTGQPYADFLLGTLNADSRQVVWDKPYFYSSSYSLFAQDDWKLSSRLTLNIGLRYELPKPVTEKYGRLTNFIPGLNKLAIASDQGIAPGVTFTNTNQIVMARQAGLPPSLVYTNYEDFAPRFGLAWRPFGGNRTVVRGGYGIFYGSAGLLVNMYGALANIFPFAISQTISRNASPSYLTFANPFPVPPNLAGAATAVSSFQPQALTPYAQNWNLTVERSIGRDMAVEIGYTGSKGTHLARSYNLNQPCCRSAQAPAGITSYPQWGTITYYGFGFDSGYQAGSITLRRRFVSNFFYRFNYTFSKSIDNGSVLQGGGAGGYAGLQDVRNLKLERGRSDLDSPHVFTASFSWVEPWKRNALVRGWQLAGTAITRSGRPFTPQLSNANLLLGEAARPNRIAKGTVADPTPNRWYDLSAFPPIAQGTYGVGTSGRNILDGPGSLVVNLALYRNFTVFERSKLQVRWEAFNTLNHTNLNLPVLFVNVPNAATITSAGAARQMQLALRYSF